MNGLTGIALTKLDILDGLSAIKICTSYKYKGTTYKKFPKEIEILTEAKPVYEELEGWKESTIGIKEFKLLPANAKKYIKRIETLLNTKIHIISTGQKRDEIIVLKDQF